MRHAVKKPRAVCKSVTCIRYVYASDLQIVLRKFSLYLK